MKETRLERNLQEWRRTHGAPECGIVRNDEKRDEKREENAKEEVRRIAEKESEREDAAEAANFEEVPAWAAGLMQTVKDLSSRVDEISAKTKGGVPEVEDGQEGTERTSVAKDASGNPAESAANGEIAARKFREAEEAEEHAQAEFSGQGESPVTASEAEQLRLQRSRSAGPESHERDKDLEDGVNRLNTQGQERSDLRGHGDDKRDHHSMDRRDALYQRQAQQIKELQAMVNKAFRRPTVEERNAIAKARKRADSVYTALGRETPEWLPGESPSAYRRRLADGLKDLSATLKKTVMDSLPEDVFNLAEDRVYADALEATKRSDVVAPLTLRPHTYMDRGHEITEYHGDPLAWMQPFMLRKATYKIVKPSRENLN